MIDVGDTFELTYTTTPGATVVVAWIDPDGVVVFDNQPVPETSPGKYTYTFTPTRAGVWEARFTASGTTTAVERFWVRAEAVTGPPPLATVGEVSSLYRPLTDAESALAKALLRRASALVRNAFPNVDAQIASGKLDPLVVAQAVINMVVRVLRNPEALRSVTTGPFTRAFDVGEAAGLLVITGAEESMLVPPGSDAAGMNFTVGTVFARPGPMMTAWARRWPR